ncbi:MAG: methionine--tRNA ligase [Candidatus Saccharimonadales bacterium]
MSKKLYITTAIPYVNGAPHIGHAMDYLLADIWARYHRANGQDVRYQIGTDEHGNKNAIKAAEQDITPQEYVDEAFKPFRYMAQKVGAEFTDVIRTTDEHHKSSVQHIWQQLKPHIYKSSYEGWYCTGCEQFYTDKEVQETNGTCPNHQKPYEHLSEVNYYLRCSDFTDQIREAIETGKMEIVPEYRKNELLELIKDGVKDVSISRPKKSLSWGVNVPDDPEQVIYVWIDALSNYITVLGYPEDDTWQLYWPADVQVIGKDILRFHALIWPSILLGIGLPLPKKILAHGFVNIGGTKISKSLGNGIDPHEIIDGYGVDAFRYYFSRHIPTLDDGDFTWEKFETAYNTELSNELGNLVQRIVAMVNRYQEGVIGDGVKAEHDSNSYHEAMRSLEFNRAIDEVWLMIRSLNVYLEDTKPWIVAKTKETDPESAAHLEEILLHAVGTIEQIADLLAPFLPTTADAIKHIFADGVISPYQGVLFPKKYLHTTEPAKH